MMGSFFIAPTPTTRRARALAKELVATVEAFHEKEPHLRPSEIRRAFRLADGRLGTGRRTLALVLAALVFLIVGITVFIGQR